MNEDADFIKATHIKDPKTGEVLTIEKDDEYGRLLNAIYSAQCQHANIARFRVRISNGQFQLRECCVDCGHRIGTALSQGDKETFASLPPQPEEHAATYKSRRSDEWRSILLDLARRQYAERGKFTKSYKEYMESDVWRSKRALILKRCGGLCEGCGIAEASEVHHVHYAHLGNEFLFELLGLCHGCHERLTRESGVRLGFADEERNRED